MDLLKKIFWPWLVGGIALIGLGLVIYFLAAWLLVDPAELKLAELERSWREEIICHELCSAARAETEKSLLAILRNRPYSQTSALFKKRLSAATSQPEFQAELIRLLGQAVGSGQAPDYLKTYLSETKTSPVVQSAILQNFSVATSSDYYFQILRADNRLTAVRLAAVRAISRITPGPDSDTAAQWENIKSLILEETTAPELRQALVLLLANYYSLFPAATRSLLETVYRTEINGDVLSRAFAADLLNHLAGEKLAAPAVSQTAWDAYYNH